MAGVVRRVVGAVEAEVDGDRILLSPKDYSYFRLGGTGAPVWDLIDGSRTLDDIVVSLESEFAAEPGTIRLETERFVAALAEAGLVKQGA